MQRAVKTSDQLALGSFTPKGVRDVLRLLHGGPLNIDIRNYEDFLKFGVQFQVRINIPYVLQVIDLVALHQL